MLEGTWVMSHLAGFSPPTGGAPLLSSSSSAIASRRQRQWLVGQTETAHSLEPGLRPSPLPGTPLRGFQGGGAGGPQSPGPQGMLRAGALYWGQRQGTGGTPSSGRAVAPVKPQGLQATVRSSCKLASWLPPRFSRCPPSSRAPSSPELVLRPCEEPCQPQWGSGRRSSGNRVAARAPICTHARGPRHTVSPLGLSLRCCERRDSRDGGKAWRLESPGHAPRVSTSLSTRTLRGLKGDQSAQPSFPLAPAGCGRSSCYRRKPRTGSGCC